MNSSEMMIGILDVHGLMGRETFTAYELLDCGKTANLCEIWRP